MTPLVPCKREQTQIVDERSSHCCMSWILSAYLSEVCKWVAVIPLPSEPTTAEPTTNAGHRSGEPIEIDDRQTNIPLIAGISTSSAGILLIIAVVLGCLYRKKLLSCCQLYYQEGRNPTYFLMLTYLPLDNLEIM